MKKLLIILFIFPCFIQAQTPSPYDRTYQDPRISKAGIDITVLQNQAAIISARLNAVIADTGTKWKDIRTLQGQMANVGGRLIIAEKAIKSLQDTVNVYKSKVLNLASRMIAQEVDSTAKGKAMRTMQSQVKALQRLDTVKGVGSIRFTKISTHLSEMENDSATKFREGNMTLYYRKLIDDQVKLNVELRTRVTALERFNNSMHGNTQASSPIITIPQTAKQVIINMKE